MKKLLLLFIIIIFAISLYAYDSDFVIDSEGNLIGYKGSESSVHIPEGVKIINTSAFENTPFITDVYLPSSINTYQQGAFYHISNLKNINIDSKNDNYISIDGILYNKTNTDKKGICVYPVGRKNRVFYIPDYVHIIRNSCFYSNENLYYVYSVKPIDKIENFAFVKCNNLKKVDLKLDNFANIPLCCFLYCSKLENIYTQINSNQKPIRSIGDFAFLQCFNLNFIDFDIFDYIGESAFSQTDVRFINIDNDTTIHKKAFLASKIYKINIDNYMKSRKKFLTLEEVETKFKNVECDTLTEIYFRGSDGQQHLYNFKTKKKVY